ncbi:NAD(P)-dependent alcohol dehydrogenase [Novacetimonas cocois]|uniref:Alcohol dehydrogenase n=1 Tax=Novacetimonas cocois TaxID=1747507 RepID=A0A365YY34_9PROT|nr:NAD(P)-dependent alcohol dehydrogenase [Novacetimonas cocois]RBM08254.1 alcohol dehydrogenase [Novacetimonas cocois]
MQTGLKSAASCPVCAAVVRKADGPFLLEQLTLTAPRDDEVRVRIVAVGMCHTDLAVRARMLETPLPVVLGHEGAGIVEQAGSAVTRVAPGDHVILTFASCGRCGPCESGHPAECVHFRELNFSGHRPDGTHALCDDSGTVLSDRFFAQSSYATHAIATERNVVKIPKDFPLELAGPLGCGISTGSGTVLNALQPGPGGSFANFGCGSVGLSGIMGASLAGATINIAIDRKPARLELARELGATHTICMPDEDVVATVRKITGGGVDTAMDTTGRVEIIRQMVDALRPGGRSAVVAVSPPGAQLELDANDLMAGNKSIQGVSQGACVPDIFLPRLIEVWRQKRFPFDRLITFYNFDQINQAVADMEVGRTVKAVLRMPEAI